MPQSFRCHPKTTLKHSPQALCALRPQDYLPVRSLVRWQFAGNVHLLLRTPIDGLAQVRARMAAGIVTYRKVHGITVSTDNSPLRLLKTPPRESQLIRMTCHYAGLGELGQAHRCFSHPRVHSKIAPLLMCPCFSGYLSAGALCLLRSHLLTII